MKDWKSKAGWAVVFGIISLGMIQVVDNTEGIAYLTGRVDSLIDKVDWLAQFLIEGVEPGPHYPKG